MKKKKALSLMLVTSLPIIIAPLVVSCSNINSSKEKKENITVNNDHDLLLYENMSSYGIQKWVTKNKNKLFNKSDSIKKLEVQSFSLVSNKYMIDLLADDIPIKITVPIIKSKDTKFVNINEANAYIKERFIDFIEPTIKLKTIKNKLEKVIKKFLKKYCGASNESKIEYNNFSINTKNKINGKISLTWGYKSEYTPSAYDNCRKPGDISRLTFLFNDLDLESFVLSDFGKVQAAYLIKNVSLHLYEKYNHIVNGNSMINDKKFSHDIILTDLDNDLNFTNLMFNLDVEKFKANDYGREALIKKYNNTQKINLYDNLVSKIFNIRDNTNYVNVPLKYGSGVVPTKILNLGNLNSFGLNIQEINKVYHYLYQTLGFNFDLSSSIFYHKTLKFYYIKLSEYSENARTLSLYQMNKINYTLNSLLTSSSQNKLSWSEIMSLSDFDKANLAYSRILPYVSYGNMSNANGGTILGLIAEKNGKPYHKLICEGYANVFTYVLNSLGLGAYNIAGDVPSGTSDPSNPNNGNGSPEKHEWNAVKVNNYWYFLDGTWDDGMRGSGFSYTYFLKSFQYWTTSGTNPYHEKHLTNLDVFTKENVAPLWSTSNYPLN